MVVLCGSLYAKFMPTAYLGKLAKKTNLRDDDDAMSLRVLLLPRSQLFGDLRNVFGAKVVRLGERHCFGLIPEQNVDIWQRCVERLLEELAYERRRKIHAKGLLVRVTVLGNLLDSRRTHGQVEAL